jgi:hypothetical protein
MNRISSISINSDWQYPISSISQKNNFSKLVLQLVKTQNEGKGSERRKSLHRKSKKEHRKSKIQKVKSQIKLSTF